MRRTVLTAGGTALGVALLLAAKPHHSVAVAVPAVTAPEQQSTTGASSGTSSGASSGKSPGASSSAGTTKSTGVRSITGGSVDTRWGPVQVKVTFNGSKITAIDVVQQPDGNPRDQEINSQAIPILTQEALAAQSANIDAVSGASYTSEGYIGSLQSALDAAK
ncbi:FMN-binding protein [Streptacidiphilus carbonis]|uniref:FMN-binding protein n=1 Tax=Streptacidiphilus carbonis TaxID=105422 RepID=UPI0005A93A51|nr:FMN-binding protein [Streptacidiphilus carbonis]